MRTALTTLVTLLTSAVLAVGLAAPAHASSSKVKDGNDIGTPLDVASVTLKTKGSKIVATLRMHDAFTDEQLTAPSSIGIDFRLNAKTTRGLAARVVDGVLTGEVCTYRRGGDVLGSGCSAAKATRLDDRTIQIVVRRAKVSKDRVLTWRASALFFSGSDCLTNPIACLDIAPNGRAKFVTWRV